MKICCLCSGRGERLKPLTDIYFKPLVPVPSSTSTKSVFVPNLQNSLMHIINHFNDENLKIYVISFKEFFDTTEWNDLVKFVLRTSRASIIEVLNSYDNRKCNNVTSVKTFFSETYDNYDEGVLFLEGDAYIASSDFLSELDKNKSTYFCEYRKNEWVFYKNPSDKAYHIVKGSDGLAMAGLSYICPKDLNALYRQISSAPYTEFWDSSLIRAKLDLELIDAGNSIKEYDNISDLFNLGMTESNIATLLSDDRPQKTSSMTNSSYIIDYKGRKKVIRFSGKGTEEFINRERERLCTNIAMSCGLTPVTEFINGIKLSGYIENAHTMTRDLKDIGYAINLIKSFHEVKVNRSKKVFVDLMGELQSYHKLIEFSKVINILKPEFFTYCKIFDKYIIAHQHEDLVLCHRDLDPRNVLILKDKGYLLDFEYSGLLNSNWDWGALVSEQELHFDTNPEDILYLIKGSCEDFSREKILEWSVIVDYVWSIWTLAKISLGEDYYNYFNQRWNRACRVAKEISMI